MTLTKNLSNSSHQAGPAKLAIILSDRWSLKLLSTKVLIIPAGKHINIPRKKTIAIVLLGSLNLSDRKKNDNIIIDGTIVINNVLIISLNNHITISAYAIVLL